MTALEVLPASILGGLPPAHVSQAMDALTGSRPLVKCGRPTKTGGSCGQFRARFMPSCRVHSTPAEREAEEAERARLTELVDGYRDSLAPACHGWAVTEADRQMVAELPSGFDELTTARRVHELIWQWQQGRCAICGCGGRQHGPGYWERHGFVLDHDHVTALVRGWLCQGCNISEGFGGYGNFVKYRERPPAVMLGVRARYEHYIHGLVEPEPVPESASDPERSPAYRLMQRFSRTDRP